jgi:L-ascorbate metabolism protein UlaG (beta-lactamase superfamily)
VSITIRCLGHSGFQIKYKDENIYIDLYRAKKYVERLPDVTEKGTIILATHGHDDHCDPKAINAIRSDKTIVIAPRDGAAKIGGNVKSLTAGEETQIRDIHIKAVPAYNVKRFRSPGNPFHPEGYGVGYVITIAGKRIYHAGDTDLIPEMKELGSIDVALLPVGDTYTMDNKEGADAAKVIKPKIVIPMHTWDKGVETFVNELKGTAITVKPLAKGEQLTVS